MRKIKVINAGRTAETGTLFTNCGLWGVDDTSMVMSRTLVTQTHGHRLTPGLSTDTDSVCRMY